MIKYAGILISAIILLTSLSADTYISINPSQVSVAPGEQIPYVVGLVKNDEVQQVFPWDFQFESKQGSFAGNVYKAPMVPGTYLVFIRYQQTEGVAVVNVMGQEPVGKIVFPDGYAPEVSVSETLPLQVKVLGKSGKQIYYQPAWLVKGGNIDGQGRFSAGNTPGTYEIIALGPDGIKATTQIVVKNKQPVVSKLLVKSSERSVTVGQSAYLSAEAYDKNNKVVPANMKWISKGQEVSGKSFEFSSEQPGVYEIVVVDTNSQVQEKVVIQVVPIPSVLSNIKIFVDIKSLYSGEKTRIEAKGYDQNNKEISFSPRWSTSSGYIENGYYIAQEVGIQNIKVIDPETGLEKGIQIEVKAKPQIARNIEISGLESVKVGETVNFSAIVYDQDNNEMNTDIEWSSSGGNISKSGEFQSLEQGTFTIIATTISGVSTQKTIVVNPEIDWDRDIADADSEFEDDIDSGDLDWDVFADDYDDSDIIDEPIDNPVLTDREIKDEAEDIIIDTRENLDEVTEDYVVENSENTDNWNADLDDSFNEDSTDFSDEQENIKDIIMDDVSVATITIESEKISLQPGESYQFYATTKNSNGQLVNADVEWIAVGGTISKSGLFTAGNRTGTFVVVARYGEIQAKADIQVVQLFQEITEISRLEINPSSITMQPGESVQFVASAYDKNNIKIAVSLQWEATGGEIDQTGRYVAGELLGQYTVRATHREKNISTYVRINIAKNNDYNLVISPENLQVKPGEKIRFQVTLQKSGKEIWSWPWEYTFIASEGNFNDMVYTAPQKPGAYPIEIRHPKTSTNIIVVVADQSVNNLVKSIEVNRDQLTLETGDTYTFTAKALNNKSEAQEISLLWNTNGGNIDNKGTFTAGTKTGKYTIEVREPISGTIKTILVEIVPKTTSKYRIEMEPKELVLQMGTQTKLNFKLFKGSFEQFSWPWEYKVTVQAGTYDSNATYTAPSEIGVYPIEVQHEKASATFAVNVIPPQIQTFTVEPQRKKVKEGKKITYTANIIDSKGKSINFPLDWSCTGGEIDTNGNYIANESGTHNIIAQIKGTDIKAETQIAVVGAMKMTIEPSPLRVPVNQSLRLTLTIFKGSEKIWAWPWEFKCFAESGSFHETLYKAPDKPGVYNIAIRYKRWVKRSKIEVYEPQGTEIQIIVEPQNITLNPLQKYQFKAVSRDSYGNELKSNLEWQAEGGVIDQQGVYTAGAVNGQYKVFVRDPNTGTETFVTVDIVEPIDRIVVRPSLQTLRPGEVVKFSAVGIRRSGEEIPVQVSWEATGGNIEASTGIYTAGNVLGNSFIVKATGQNGLKGTAEISISQMILKRLRIVPENVVLGPGETLQFKAVGVDENENEVAVNTKWFAIGGVIDENGVYRAGEKSGKFYVTVIDSNSHLFTKSSITIERKLETFSQDDYSLKIAVSSSDVKPGENVVIKPTLMKAENIEWAWPWEFKYKASGGFFVGEYGNIWIAPNYAGTYTITIEHKKVTKQIYIKVNNRFSLEVSRIVITPDKISLKPGEMYKFNAVAYKSNGEKCSCPIAWQATGGSIDQSGTYQAGQKTGTYEVKAYYEGIEKTVVITISESESTYQQGLEWGRSLRSNIVSRNQIHKFIYSNIFTKDSEELEQFRRGFIDSYGASGLYLIQELLCGVASDFGKIYGHNLYWGNVTKTQLANFIKSFILRLPNTCHHSFKQGFLSGYKHYKGSSIYEQVYRWAKYQ